MKPFTIWTQAALKHIQLCVSTEYGGTFGVSHWTSVDFRFYKGQVHAHTLSCKGQKRDASGIMERRGS